MAFRQKGCHCVRFMDRNIEEEYLYGEDGSNKGEIIVPFNPKDVDIVSQTMVVANVIERLKDGRIILDPDYQRNYDLWDDRQQSRLIESLMVRIPLPTFYFDYDNEMDSYTVVDGLQRLWAIRRFAALDIDDPDRLRLTDLEYLTEYEGFTYEELPAIIQRRIREESLITYVIRPGTPDNVRNSIFTRINTGGLQLTPAEIKNSIYRGKAAKFLRELAGAKCFIEATNHRVDPSRMADRELVNRFLAFYVLNISDYPENLELFMNEVLQRLKHTSEEDMTGYRKAFYQAMETAHELFGDKAFRKKQKNNRYGKLNKPLFECVSVCLARLSKEECMRLVERKNTFLEKYDSLLQDKDFQKVITNATAKISSIEKRYKDMSRIIGETIN